MLTALGIAVGGLAGCAQLATPDEGMMPPVLNPVTETNRSLRDLAPPSRKVAVAVYGFQDQTGQLKPSDTIQSFSKAVTQGGSSVLIKALQDAGSGKWFTVVERERLDNLLKERRIIVEMRQLYLGEKELNTKALPPLLFAGVLIDGGIIGYDTNTATGGAGANYLGIGGSGKYRQDSVTVYLRATSTKTGEVLNTVVVHKTIASVGVDGNIFKYVVLDKILQTEAGFTKNEPVQVAVQQAVEKAVYTLIVDGAERKLWRFANKAVQAKLIASYHKEQFGETGDGAGKHEVVKAKPKKSWAAAAFAP